MIHQKLKALRERMGLSQQALSEESGLSQARISHFENGQAQTLSNLQAYAIAVGATVTLSPSGEWSAELPAMPEEEPAEPIAEAESPTAEPEIETATPDPFGDPDGAWA